MTIIHDINLIDRTTTITVKHNNEIYDSRFYDLEVLGADGRLRHYLDGLYTMSLGVNIKEIVNYK